MPSQKCGKLGNFEEELPKPTVSKLSANSGLSANRQAIDRSIRPYKQLTDRLPTDQFDRTNS